MLIGHIGIAYGAKRVQRSAPLGWLVVAAMLPDIVKVLVFSTTRAVDPEVVSHSAPAAALLALALAGVWRIRDGGWDVAAMLALMCILHPVADLVTGCKPLLPGGPWIGMRLYTQPIADVVVECGLFVLGWSAARRVHGRGWWPASRLVLTAAVIVQLGGSTFMAFRNVFYVGPLEYIWIPQDHERWPRFVRRRASFVAVAPCTA